MENEFELTKEVKRQILAVRNTGITNMFNSRNVLEIAKELGFDELVELVKNNPKEYFRFILTGKREDVEEV